MDCPKSGVLSANRLWQTDTCDRSASSIILTMKKDRRSKALHSFAIVSGVAFLGLSLFASVLFFQTPPDEIRKNGVQLEGKVLKKTRSATSKEKRGQPCIVAFALAILFHVI